ncbi:ribosomal protein S27AE [Haloferula luteola]|uniref:Ribosomal protein S27AE n=1 Tax=Haloferula luteola TaxID=595692 RepID=A0A840VHC6_9BACT|nr:hypothetical protein [Haloferula luteola]MBB5352161.1 ribosomal protein S27AE [Haloferula luteola]
MTEKAEGWYHCGRCGHLYEAADTGLCPQCGESPIISDSEVAYHQAVAETREVAATSASLRPRGKSDGLVKFTLAWLGFLVVIGGVIALARAFREEGPKEALDFSQQTESLQEINEAFSKCYPKVRAYYSSVSPELRGPLTLHPSRTLERMSRWPEEMVLIDASTLLRNQTFRVFQTSEGETAAGRWELENGDRVEAVFRKDDEDQWAIDWEQMVRYSSEVWPVFLSGLSQQSGEFRLLARRRATDSLGVGDVSRIVFHQPSARRPGEYGHASPEVIVDPNSEDGMMLSEAFRLRDAGDAPFHSRLTEGDPAGMIRVRVRLTLGPKDEHGRVTLRLDKVMACHWMDLGDSGMDEKKAPAAAEAPEEE